jgi:Tfp pilus assembly protein PilF
LNATAHSLFAEALAGGDNLPQAAEEYRVAIELDPDRIDVRQALATLQLRMGNRDGARGTLEELLARDPEHRVARRMLEDLQENSEP